MGQNQTTKEKNQTSLLISTKEKIQTSLLIRTKEKIQTSLLIGTNVEDSNFIPYKY